MREPKGRNSKSRSKKCPGSLRKKVWRDGKWVTEPDPLGLTVIYADGLCELWKTPLSARYFIVRVVPNDYRNLIP